MHVLLDETTPGEVPPYAAGAALLDITDEDGEPAQALSIWTSDGRGFASFAPRWGSFTVDDDGMRCNTFDDGEDSNCGTASEPGEDGMITVTPDDPELEPYTVQLLN